jgi:hypothetical protein
MGVISYGPMIAAFIVLAVVAGRGCVAGLWKQKTLWRVGRKWWLLAPGVLIAVHMCALMINIALGARIVNTAHVESLPACLSVTVLPLLLLGGQYQEPGWMGYAQRHRQERFAESVLCLSHSRCRHHPNDLAYAVAGLWHHPPGSTASSGHSRCKSFAPGSMTGLAMIAHLFSNVMAATMKPLFNPADQERYWLTWLSFNASQRSA